VHKNEITVTSAKTSKSVKKHFRIVRIEQQAKRLHIAENNQ